MLLLGGSISHQGDTTILQHHYHSLKARGVRGRNTENLIIKLDGETANCQGRRYVLMKFFHREKHIVFSGVGEGRRKKEVYDGIEVIIAIPKEDNINYKGN